MTALLIRRIDDPLKRALRLRAAANSRSMEAEVRHILRAALAVPSPEERHERRLEEIETTNRATHRARATRAKSR